MEVWVVRAGPGSEHAVAFEKHGLVALGLDRVPNASGWPQGEVIARVAELLDESPAKASAYGSLLERFVHEVAVGDAVLTPDSGHSEVLVGVVVGPYEFLETPPVPGYPHVRRVKWQGRAAWNDLPAQVRRGISAPMAVFRPAAQDAVTEALTGLGLS
jgi:predicted Mrr-cat superfamily restriction endonuclease